jgi:cell fate (sporulation/competence/biofilm development) regulator YlbF (YheA/YmcA/DUF963 family)
MYKNFKQRKKNVQKFQTKKKNVQKFQTNKEKITRNFNFSKIFYEKINRLDTLFTSIPKLSQPNI